MRRNLGLALALTVGAVSAAVYVRALGAGFYSDDYEWLGRMAPALERPLYVFHVFYRDFNPLLHLSFLGDFLIGSGSASVFHGTSIAVHALCAVLLVLLCTRLTGDRPWLGAAAALTWAVNVRLSETPIWPAARGHALATLFVLAALLVLGSTLPRKVVLATILFALALLAKEVAFFPLLLAPLFLEKGERRLPSVLPLYALAAAFVAFNVSFKSEFHTSPAPWGELVLKVPFILLRPIGLADFYDFRWPTLIALAAAFAVALWLSRRTKVLVGLVWLAVCTAPIVPLDKLSSRYLYVLSVGYALVLCGIGDVVWRALRGGPGRSATGALTASALTLLTAANVLRIQREIDDYAILARPYEACLASFREPVRTLRAGETLVLVDASSHDVVRQLGETIRARGNMSKLVPYRPGAVGGLIGLADLINALHREPGMLAHRAEPGTSPHERFMVYDGRSVRELAALPASNDVPRERLHAAAWGPAEEYFAASRP